MATLKEHALTLAKHIKRMSTYVEIPDDRRPLEWREQVCRDPKTMDALMFNYERAVDKVEKILPFLRENIPDDWSHFIGKGNPNTAISEFNYREKNLFRDAQYLSDCYSELREVVLQMPHDQKLANSQNQIANKTLNLGFRLHKNARSFLKLGSKEALANDAVILSDMSNRFEKIESYKKDLLKSDDDTVKTYDAMMHHVRAIASHARRLSPQITDRYPAFKTTKMLDFEESKMRESVKPITIAEVTKATTEYAPDLNVTVELAREQVKTQTRSMAKARSISSLLRLPKNEKEEERFQTKSLHLVD